MATITPSVGSDGITTANFMTKNNANLANLNSDKMETSVLDTDTTLAANSDLKVATQKAVKAYVDVGGNVNASETVRGIVEEASDAEVTAGTATGATGAKLIVTPAKLSTRLTSVLANYQATLTWKNGSTTYDVSTASGTQTIAHGLGKIPKKIKITASWSMTTDKSHSSGVYNGTTNSVAHWSIDVGNAYWNSGANSTQGVVLRRSDATKVEGVLTFDATNITITWTKTGSPTGTAQIMWEAEG